MRKHAIPALLGAFTLVALMGYHSAVAQTAPAGATPNAAAHAPVHETPSAPSSMAPQPLSTDIAAKVEAHIKKLHDQLKITVAEQAQWDQFAQVMRDNAAAMHQALDERGDKVATMDASDNMQSYAQLAQVHATNMQKLASAFQTLYSSLPDSQKQVADTVFRKQNAMAAPHKS